MKRAQLEKIVHHSPFHPFRLVLVDGEEVVVRHPKAHVSGDDVTLVGVCTRPGRIGVERFRIINIERVVSAEPIGNGNGASAKRRKRR